MSDLLRQYLGDFPELSREEIEAIVRHTHVRTFKKKSILLREGAISSDCYFILSGCVRQYKVVDGEEKTLAFFTEGQVILSYDSYMDSVVSDHYLSCEENCTLLIGTREGEKALRKEFPKLNFLTHILMPKDLANSQKQLSILISSSPEERYKYLLEHQPELLNRVPLYQLASYIGVTPESFSRIRKRITQQKQ